MFMAKNELPITTLCSSPVNWAWILLENME